MSFAPPVDALNRGHGTLWGNLGDWSAASSYVDAAEALARRLGEAAGLAKDHVVADLGCGAGDQLRLWVESFGVAHVTAVERDPELARRAAERVRAWGLERRVAVVQGESETVLGCDVAMEGSLDRVLALDSAYFFGQPPQFLARCRSSLQADGVLALTDLLVGDGSRARLASLVAPLFGVRQTALMTETQYRSRLARIGFEDVRIEDCTTDVLVGFSRWTRGRGVRRCAEVERGAGTASGPGLAARAGLAFTGRMAGALAHPTGLRYVLVTARRGSA